MKNNQHYVILSSEHIVALRSWLINHDFHFEGVQGVYEHGEVETGVIIDQSGWLTLYQTMPTLIGNQVCVLHLGTANEAGDRDATIEYLQTNVFENIGTWREVTTAQIETCPNWSCIGHKFYVASVAPIK